MKHTQRARSGHVESPACLVKVQTALVIEVTVREHGKTGSQRLTKKIGLGETQLVVGQPSTALQVHRHVLTQTKKIVRGVTQPQKAAGRAAHTTVETDAVAVLFF